MIEILDCPFSIEIKNNILSWLDTQEFHTTAGGSAYKTNDYIDIHIPEIKKLFDWIENNTNDIANKFATFTSSLYNSESRQHTKNFKVDTYWGLTYPINSWIEPHNHFPHALSFTYYVNVPQESAPLIINDQKHWIKEGQLVIFPSLFTHWVPPAIVNGRTSISGDIVYLSRFGN